MKVKGLERGWGVVSAEEDGVAGAFSNRAELKGDGRRWGLLQRSQAGNGKNIAMGWV